MLILGISGNFYRESADASATLIEDGRVIAAAEEERFTRVKHAPSRLPENAIQFCLKQAGISIEDVDVLAFPQTTWRNLEENLNDWFDFQFQGRPKAIEFVEHHRAHAASAYRVSGFGDAIILTADWSGDGVALTLSHGTGSAIKTIERFGPPSHSLGMYYSLMTQYLGFQKWDDEYKVMGLASYGQPAFDLSWLLRSTDDAAGFVLDPTYVHQTALRGYPEQHGLQQPTFSRALIDRLGPARLPGSEVTDRHRDIAASVQFRLEEVVKQVVQRAHELTGSRRLCIAGGVGLNCSMNGALLEMDCIDEIFVPPVASDAGLSLGAAVEVASAHGFSTERLERADWGPEYGHAEIRRILERSKLDFEEPADLIGAVAEALTRNQIIGWFQGRMEFGPRALGSRSILADPRQADMKDRINYYVKFREDFRPFAPSILAEHADDYVVNGCDSPFMTVTFPVKPEKHDVIPAVTHVDGTCRAQTVSPTNNLRYYQLIDRFNQLTGVPVVLNTSLNVRGDPVAMKPEDAISTFYTAGLDVLAIGDFIVKKPRSGE